MTLLLLPGMDGTGDLFDPFVAALGPEFNAVVVRYPEDEPLDYAQLETLVRASLPTEGQFVIVAESFSGPIAVSIAATAPRGLRGLVLCCSFIRNPRPILAVLGALAGAVPASRAQIGVMSHFMLGRFATPALREAVGQAVLRVSASALRSRMRSVVSVDVSAALARVRVPVMYLRATHDRIVPAAASRLLLEHCPSATVVEVAAPHLLLQAAPSQAVALVTKFLAEPSRTSN